MARLSVTTIPQKRCYCRNTRDTAATPSQKEWIQHSYMYDLRPSYAHFAGRIQYTPVMYPTLTFLFLLQLLKIVLC